MFLLHLGEGEEDQKRTLENGTCNLALPKSGERGGSTKREGGETRRLVFNWFGERKQWVKQQQQSATGAYQSSEKKRDLIERGRITM